MDESKEQTKSRIQKFMDEKNPDWKIHLYMGNRRRDGNNYIVTCQCMYRPKAGWLGGYIDHTFLITKNKVTFI